MSNDERSDAEQLAERLDSWAQNEEMIDQYYTAHGKDCVGAAAAIRAAAPSSDARAEYERKNPLGGPATMFEAIAERIRAGEDYYAVLADYDLCVVNATPQPRQMIEGRDYYQTGPYRVPMSPAVTQSSQSETAQPDGAKVADYEPPAGWHLTCDKCGIAQGDRQGCRWPTNCPTGIAAPSPSVNEESK